MNSELSKKHEELTKKIYLLAVEKNQLDKEARSLIEYIAIEKRNLAEQEHKKLSEEIHTIDKKLRLLSEQDQVNQTESTILLQRKEKLTEEFVNIYHNQKLFMS